MSLLHVAAEEPVLESVLIYLGEEGNRDTISLQCVSPFFQKLLEQRHRNMWAAKHNKPYISYELHTKFTLNQNLTGTFKLVNSLLLPVSSGDPPYSVSLLAQQQLTLVDCKPRVAFMNNAIGWGVKSGTVVPRNKLLFAYYGEFISTVEATNRHAMNERKQVI